MDPLQDPGTYLKIILGLGGTILVFLGFGYYLRRFPNTLVTGKGRLVQVLARQSLDRSRSFYLIEALGKVYLLYGTTEKMQLIDSFDKEEVQDYLKELSPDSILPELVKLPGALSEGSLKLETHKKEEIQ